MNDKLDRHLEDIDPDKRETIKKLVLTTAFAIPMIASFPLDGRLTVAQAQEQSDTANNSTVTFS